MNAEKWNGGTPDNLGNSGDPGNARDALENEFRAMFAERSETVRMTTAPYAAVRRRITVTRRKRRLRIGSAGVAFAVAVVGVGVWATVPSAQHSAVAPTSTNSTSTRPASGGPAKVVYADGHTEIPSGPLRDAALNWLGANYHGTLAGLTVVTTFDQSVQNAAGAVPEGSGSGGGSARADGVAVVNPGNGAVLALGGAWDRPLPVADLMKPIVLAAAFATRDYNAESTEQLDTQMHPLYWPLGAREPMTYVDANGRAAYWPPESPTVPIHDEDITLVQAAELGYNGPFVRLELQQDVTPAMVRDIAVGLGMPKDTQNLVAVPALALGAASSTPLTMACVYATFADGGVRRDPRMVGALLAKNGRTVWTPPDKATRVLPQDAAQEITSVLHATLLGGPTATGVKSVARDDPGMWATAGAADTEKSAWLAGADSGYVIAAAVSSTDDGGALRPLGTDHHGGLDIGSEYAGPIWADVVQAVRKHG